MHPPAAKFGQWWATDLAEVTDSAAELRAGRWAVMQMFEGALVAARFSRWETRTDPPEGLLGTWQGPAADRWSSSMARKDYTAAVRFVQDAIGRGDVYQVNVCRTMHAGLPNPGEASDVGALHMLLSELNPAPYEGFIRIPGVELATASPELFLARQGDLVTTGPIKGTGRTQADLLPKDDAENVMIVDLMRNDLSRVCLPGSVWVPSLLQVEHHPGLVHLVSYVSGHLQPGIAWSDILEALTPPGSVSGAPKIAAVDHISQVEPVARGPYCGVVGWIDVDSATAQLAVGIRTFWLAGAMVRFGTGAGITWGSDPEREWQETELKAAKLVAAASGTWGASRH